MTRYTPQWLQAGSYAASQDRRLIGALWPAAASTGCQVTAGTAMTVNVAPGQVAVPTQNNTGTTLCSSDAVEAVTLTAAPPSGQNRIDLVICRPRGNDLDGGANTDFIFDVVTGTAAPSPSVPAVPVGTVALAQIAVAGGSASIVAGNITDRRPSGLAVPPVSGTGSFPRGWVASIVGPASQVNAGQSQTTIIALTVALVAGRRYRVSAQILASQQGSNGSPQSLLNDTAVNIPANIVRPFWSIATVGAGIAVTGTASWSFVAAATGNDTISLTAASATAGTCQVSPNNAQLTLEDIGSQ